MKIAEIQAELKRRSLDGWLFYFFKNNDPIALSTLELTETHMFSRRWFYFIPAEGEPGKLVHRIESGSLDALPGTKLIYVGWSDMEKKLAELLGGSKTVAMQYSPRNAIPYVARVDAGTIELIRSLGVTVTSSADLVQNFEAVWSDKQLESHIYAVDKLRSIVDDAFVHVRDTLERGGGLTEYDLQQFILGKFDLYEMTTYSPPIVAVNENSGNPHY